MKVELNNYQDAFTNLFNNYHLELYNTAFKMTKSKPIAEDIVHDVFLKLWLKRRELTKIEKFHSYLHVMTRNRVLDNFKKYKRESPLSEKIEYSTILDDDIEDRVMSREYALILEKAITDMPYKQRRAFSLVKENGLSHKETASILQISDLTVKKHIANALKFISNHFEIYGMSFPRRSQHK